ncbi:MAG: neuraminidase-like domain-containing protein, partial [Anderseniella sp.]|nr:neuraminidase-like domain-containing protein [Anderseniella sp.]
MNKITFPLNQGDSSPAAADLQDALLELVGRGILLAAESDLNRARLLVALRRERAEQSYGSTTNRLVRQFQQEKRLEATGAVDERTANALNALLRELGLLLEEPRPEQPGFEVRGRVSLADGSPAAGLKVMAVDRDLRREQALGEAPTGRNGGYHIRYSERQFQRAEKGRADLIVRVLGPDGGVLAASEILFNAPESATVDLVIAEDVLRPASEFERIDSELAPLLDGVPLAELTSEDVAFLTGETGIDQQLIHNLASAAKLSSATHIVLSAHYGMLREGLPADLASLLQQSRSSQRHALDAAIRNKRIAPLTAEAIDAVLDALQDALAETALNEPDDLARPSVSSLLNSGLLPLSRNQKKAFLKLYLRPEERVDDLWDTVSRLPEFQQASQVEDLKLTLQIGNLTQNHGPLVQTLHAMRKANRLSSFRELARLTPEEWMRLIRQSRDEHAPVVPQDISGDTEDEKISTYARQISEQLENAFPTLSVAYRVERDELPGRQELTTFFKRSIIDRENLNPDIPEFDFARTDIDRYLNDHADTLLADVPDRQALYQRLKGMQRLFKVTPSYNEMKPLLQSGLHSAQGIVRLGADQFVKRFAGQLGDEERAVELYDKAEQQNAMSMAVLLKYGSLFNGVKLEVVPSVPQLSDEDLAAIPDWPSLFGSLDFCACPHCQSVYSPAAYLVDVLHFLHTRCPAKMPNESAKDILFKRRGDIGKIELSCVNTNTPVPYIDLVNEILENTVAPSTNYPQQTRDTAGEIAANPEHVNAEAYNRLRRQVYPWSLPFDCWATQCRIYLGQLCAKRVEIMEVFSNRTRAETLTDREIAREYLGLNPPEWDVIIGAEQPSGLGAIQNWEYWGYLSSANWLEEVAHLPVFLEKSGLSHPELLELLTTRFVNPAPKQRVLDISPQDACRLDDMSLHPQNNVTQDRLDRMHRFIRLQRNLGWTMVELDQAFTALRPVDDHGVPMPTPIFLLQLSHIERLRTTLKLPIVQILSFWSTLDAVSYESAKGERKPSLYERLFQNKTLLGDSKEDMQAFALNNLSSASFSEHGAILTAILRISSADLTLLQEQLGLPDYLSLESLSALYRHAILSKALKLKLPELIVCKTLTGIDPFAPEHTENTLLFAEALQQIRLAGFSLQELNYLFLHIDNPSKGVGPSDADLSEVAEKLRNELNRIALATRFDAPSEDLFRTHLATVLSEEELVEAFDFLDTCPENTSENQKSITEHFGLFLPEEPDYTKLLAPEKTEDAAKKQEIRDQAIAYLLPYLSAYLCNQHSRTTIKQILSETLKLDKSVTTLLVDSVLLSQTNTGTSERYVIDDFLGLGEEEQQAPISDTFKKSYLRLWKASVLVSRFGLSMEEIAYLSKNSTDFAGFDLNQFPLEPVASSAAPSLFKLWQRLYDYVSLRDGVASTKVGLTDVFAQASSPDAAKQTLADATGWDIGELSALTADDLSNEVRLIRLRDQLALSHRLGVDTTTLKDWCAYPEDGQQAQQQAQAIKNALKSRYDDALWLEVAKPLRNTLREQQRSALVASVLARKPHLKDSNDLYDHLLIDVEMSACQMTSRIKQAISSVQLFVQRCLMGLEPDVTLDESVIAQWKWMKNYRVW